MLGDPAVVDVHSAGDGTVVEPERVVAFLEVVVDEHGCDGLAHRATEDLLVLAGRVVAGRADLDLDAEQLRIGVDDQRADAVAEVEQHRLGANLGGVVMVVRVVR